MALLLPISWHISMPALGLWLTCRPWTLALFLSASPTLTCQQTNFDHSVRSPYDNSFASWTPSHSSMMHALRLSPTRQKADPKLQTAMSASSRYIAYSSDILQGTLTPHSSDYTVNENDYLTPGGGSNAMGLDFGPKFTNNFFSEIWMLMHRNFKNIRRTPELFLSWLMVLTVMGFMMATMLSFFIFTVCLSFFSSSDAMLAFIQDRFIFIREISHNAYRASSYVITGLITYLPFLGLQAAVYAGIVWFALKLRGSFLYFLLVLYVSLLSTNSFVVFVSSVVPNYILGYVAVIACTALFFLFCGYFLNGHDIPTYWKLMNKISTMTYPCERLLMNEYRTTEVFGFDNEGRAIEGLDILSGLHISPHAFARWKNELIMLGWAIFYRCLFYIIMRFASKNQRK